MMRSVTLLLTIVFLLLGLTCSGQQADSLKLEKIAVSRIAGTYKDGPLTLVIKKKNKYKTIWTAPRPLVCKGTWKIQNDTLICSETHRNTNINNEGKKVKGNPITYKLILVNGMVYSVVDEIRILIVGKK